MFRVGITLSIFLKPILDQFQHMTHEIKAKELIKARNLLYKDTRCNLDKNWLQTWALPDVTPSMTTIMKILSTLPSHSGFLALYLLGSKVSYFTVLKT